MRALVYYIATSIDGFIAKQDGSVDDFLMEGPHADDFVKDIQAFDTVLMGGNTYEMGFSFGLKPGEPAYPGLKHWVLSSRLDFPSNDQVERIDHHGLERVKELKQSAGGSIWLCGGGQLAGALLKEGLIDEIKLKINPFSMGAGIPLFTGAAFPAQWSLQETHAYDNGVVRLHYRR